MFNKALPELLPLTSRESNEVSPVADVTHLIDSLRGELSATELSSRHQRAGKEQRKLNCKSDRQFQQLGHVFLGVNMSSRGSRPIVIATACSITIH